VVTADPSIFDAASEPAGTPPSRGDAPGDGNPGSTGPGAGDDRLPPPAEEPAPEAPAPSGTGEFARADAAVDLPMVAASASAKLSTGPTGEAPAAAAGLDASIAEIAAASLEVSVETAATESGSPSTPKPQARGLYSNALAGSVSGLIGGMASPESGSATRVQVRNDNRVVIGPGSQPPAPTVPHVQHVPMDAGAVPPPLEVRHPVVNATPSSVPEAGAPGLQSLVPTTGSAPPGGPAANARVDLPTGIGINAGAPGLGINAGQLGIRVNTGPQ